MEQLRHTFANCPPYLLALGSFSAVVVFALFRLYGMLQGLGL